MNLTALHPKGIINDMLFQAGGLLFVFLVPTLSHLLTLPIYYLEPMRLVVILSICHSGKSNSILLALTLPMFSFLISGHPILIKAGLISVELIINVLLIFSLNKKTKNTFIVVFTSIILSKVIYYAIKYTLVSKMILGGSLISTPMYFQLPMAIILSYYVYRAMGKSNEY